MVPVRNEAAHLPAAIDAIVSQAYPGSVEVVLAVGPSLDGTETVAAELALRHPQVRVVSNDAGSTPAGLNAAIRASTAPIVARVDGHSRLSPGYLKQAVRTLERTGAVNVGGIQRAVGVSAFERAVAAAMTSRFGTGDARFHYGGHEGPTDTVYLGVFRRDALERAGLFDETLVRNQDYELNIRLRANRGVVWFDPELSVEYRPRGTWRSLARQYFEYGQWKREVLRRHPGSLRWRQALPPLAVSIFMLGAVIGRWWRPGLIAPLGYAAATSATAVAAGRRDGVGTVVRLLGVFPTIHTAWSIGVLVGPRSIPGHAPNPQYPEAPPHHSCDA